MATFYLGMNAKIYQGAAGADIATITEMSNVKDVTLTLEAGEADLTTRGSQGWREIVATLRECSSEFEMLWKPSDAGFTAIKTAFITGGQVRLAILTDAKDASGSEGMVGDFSITGFTRNESLEEGVTVSVTVKLSVFSEWLEVA